jgi:hypothetical protein
VLSLLLLILVLPLRGQDYIRRDFYGQGSSYQQALDALIHQVGQVVPFETPALVETYRADISRSAVEQMRNGKTTLSLSGTDLDALFQARQNRAAGILEQGQKSRDDAVTKTYYIWAWYYLYSLPPEHQLPGRNTLKSWLLNHADIAPAKLQIPMTHIESEVAAIRRIAGDIYAPAPVQRELPAKETPVKTIIVEEQKPRAGQAAIASGYSLFRPVEGPSLPIGPVALPPKRQEHELPTVPHPLRLNILATFSLAPELTPGLLITAGKKWGGVISAQSNFKSAKANYSAMSSGTRADGEGYIWPGGNHKTSLLSVGAGGYYHFIDWLGAYATAGYGHRSIFWEDTEGQWAQIEDLSARGVALSAGILFRWKFLCATAGISTISFQTLGVSLGVGFSIPFLQIP